MNHTLSFFDGISKEEYERMLVCFHAAEKTYQPGETICFYSDIPERIGYIEEGEAAIVCTHYDGHQSILEYLHPGDVFGSVLSAVSPLSGTLQVICKKACRLQFINYEHLIKRCENACHFHSLLVSNALQLISRKAILLSERLEVLSQRSIRDKLLCYFSQIQEKQHSNTFLLPFSLSTLADYLSVDRSAMMRELKKMKEEGILDSSRNRITLLEAD